METLIITDTQGMEICEHVDRMLAKELDSENVWNKIKNVVADYLKNNNISTNASDLTDKLEWSVRVKLKK
jgi:hypothetical protein